MSSYSNIPSYLAHLNEQQREAALTTDGPLLVVAGAGTGKTTTLVHRIIHLIKTGVHPHAIMAITFTNKAAQEMRERVHAALPEYSEKPFVSTFHALGVRILREHGSRIGLSRYFTTLDSSDSRALIKQAMKDRDIDPQQWEPKTIASIIGHAKAKNQNPDELEVSNNPAYAITQEVWRRYEELKLQEKALDFADLLVRSYRLLKDYPEVLQSYHTRFSHFHVDEYQDTNAIQKHLVTLLSQEKNNICAVGDGDQTIYSWRGADIKNILHFEKDFPGAKVVILDQNYRSSKNILNVAHHIISKNTERIDTQLNTNKPGGTLPIFYEAFSGKQEATWVAQTIKEQIAAGVPAAQIAVLFRTNFQSRLLEEACLYHQVPYHVIGVKFFERKEIKDVMSYIRAALDPASLTHLKRVINTPKRGIGKVAVAKIFSNDPGGLSPKAQSAYQHFQQLLSNIQTYAQENTVSDLVRYVIIESGFQTKLSQGSAEDQERLENMKELVTYAQKYDGYEDGLDIFLEEVALLSDQDNLSQKESENRVKLMTIHASKGLEFQHVFVVGLEQGLFPSQRDDAKTNHEREEERRLCYVAFTRAKDQLYLSYAKLRTIYGQQRINEPSEFLRDIPDELLTYAEEDRGDDEFTSSYLIF